MSELQTTYRNYKSPVFGRLGRRGVIIISDVMIETSGRRCVSCKPSWPAILCPCLQSNESVITLRTLSSIIYVNHHQTVTLLPLYCDQVKISKSPLIFFVPSFPFLSYRTHHVQTYATTLSSRAVWPKLSAATVWTTAAVTTVELRPIRSTCQSTKPLSATPPWSTTSKSIIRHTSACYE